jgi:AcrR family transcriptional regulator
VRPCGRELGGALGLRSDAARNREQLLDAALRLFHERGLKVPSLSIAEAAGLGVGTLYRHFPTREDLTAALAHRSYRIALDHATETADGDEPALEALHTFFCRTIERSAPRWTASSPAAARREPFAGTSPPPTSS